MNMNMNQFNPMIKIKLDINAPSFLPKNFKAEENYRYENYPQVQAQSDYNNSANFNFPLFSNNPFENKENNPNYSNTSGIVNYPKRTKNNLAPNFSMLDLLPSKRENVPNEKQYEIGNFVVDNNCFTKICKSTYLTGNSHSKKSILNQSQPFLFSTFQESKINPNLCNICLEEVTKKKRFGLLMNCDHVFCLDCIKSWRDENINSKKTELHKQCPICKAESLLIIPSESFVTDKEKKIKMAQENKKKMSHIPCKYLKKGKDQCPFKSNCFYMHPKKDS